MSDMEAAKVVSEAPSWLAWLLGGGLTSGGLYMGFRRIFSDRHADKREATLDAATTALISNMQNEIKRLSLRVDELSERVEKCDHDRLALMEELVGLRNEAGRRRSDKP